MDNIEKAFKDAAPYLTKKTSEGYKGVPGFDLMPNCNSPVECMVILNKLNRAIELMSELQDSHYIEWIFNSSTVRDAWLEEFEPWISKTEDKLIKLRALMFGDNLDWDFVCDLMYDNCLAHEVYWHKSLDDSCKRFYRENESLKVLLRQNGITKDNNGKDI